jgi:hypothetical protein
MSRFPLPFCKDKLVWRINMSDIQEPEQKKTFVGEPKFNYEVKNRKAFANSPNIKMALDYLDTKNAEDIQLVKTDKRRTPQRDNLMVALYLANEALGKGEHIKQRALQILHSKLGVDPFKQGKFLGATARTFNRKWEEIRSNAQPSARIQQAAQNAAKEIKQPFTSQSSTVSQTVGQPATSTGTGIPPKPQETPAEQPKAEQPAEQPKEEPKTEQPTQGTLPSASLGDLSNKSQEELKADIRKLRDDTKSKIEATLKKVEGSDDITANMQAGLVTNTLRRYLVKMDRYLKNANAGSYSARQALIKADSASTIAQHTAEKHTMHRALRRTAERIGETGRSVAARTKESAKRFNNWNKQSETMEKIRQNVKPAMEKVKQGVESGVEKVQAGVEGRNQQNLDLVTSMLGQAAGEEYKKANTIKRAMMIRKAKAKRNSTMKPQQAQGVQTPPPVPPKQIGYTAPQLPAPTRTESTDVARKVLSEYVKKGKRMGA